MNCWNWWVETMEGYRKMVCPKCGKPLVCWIYINEWHEFLVCNDCRYAKEVSR